MDLDLGFLRDGLITFLLLVASLSIHEWAHAFVADRLGDDTPRMQGRVTLNPLAHVDPIGTGLIPLINIFVFRGSFALIGWGRPVMTNPSNFRHKVRDDLLVTIAGPASNLVLVGLATAVGALVIDWDPRMAELANRMVMINLALAVFNLMPLPPLDGGRVMRHIVGMSEETFYQISRWSGLVMLLLINLQAFRRVLYSAMQIAAIPFGHLCAWINPDAVPYIFRHLF